ncbi:MAG TPA: hypothetical protein DEQ09_09990 [Bacteroidales bacterium]|nr:hypothetical protein [Bacteroidales bacterium]
MRLISLFFLVALLAYGCSDLEIVNENEPDISRVFTDADAILNVAGASFRTIHNQMQEYSGLAPNMGCMADNMTMSWGKTRDLSYEPRTLWECYYNSPDYPYYYQLKFQWKKSYEAITHSNNILRYLYNDASEIKISDDKRVLLEAFSWFSSGVAHGYLGLVFDKSLIVYYDSNPEDSKLVSWDTVITESLRMINRAIEISDANIFKIPPEWGRVDHRIINLMDHDYPSHWPRDNISWNTVDGQDPGEADPDDARLLTDFMYLESNIFRPDRGYYHPGTGR